MQGVIAFGKLKTIFIKGQERSLLYVEDVASKQL